MIKATNNMDINIFCSVQSINDSSDCSSLLNIKKDKRWRPMLQMEPSHVTGPCERVWEKGSEWRVVEKLTHTKKINKKKVVLDQIPTKLASYICGQQQPLESSYSNQYNSRVRAPLSGGFKNHQIKIYLICQKLHYQNIQYKIRLLIISRVTCSFPINLSCPSNGQPVSLSK